MSWRPRSLQWLRAAMLILSLLFTHGAIAAEISTGEQIVLFPSLARREGDRWKLQVHGIIYEPEQRRFLARTLRRLMGIDEEELSPAEQAVFKERSQYFLVDNERGKDLMVRLDETDYPLGASAANGHFAVALTLRGTQIPFATSETADTNLALEVALLAKGKEARRLFLQIQCLQSNGWSVISDIDDTIKISQVRDRDALLRNTFCRPFKPVSGMADLYQSWARSAGAQFHYLTASPWQLYLPLSEFVRTNGFPAGTFHMKSFRAKDKSLLELFASPEKYKPKTIESLLAQFPQRKFVLVGDSGEKDPEIYGAIARKHPSQIQLILIRDVTTETADSLRYRRAFSGCSRDLWRLFENPDDIRHALPAPSAK